LNFIQKIKDALFPTPPTQVLDASFIFPYSQDKQIKRQQIWDNLQKGILFEDTGTLLPWLTTFSAIHKFAEQRRNSGDRTNWFLGKHDILDGYPCYVGLMKWIFVKDSNPISEIEEWLGSDNEGNEKFLFLKEKLTDLFGEPSFIELEKFGDLDIGSIEWADQKVRIRLSGIEQFSLKYRLYIGLIDNKNK
jgi:hypothetical protein